MLLWLVSIVFANQCKVDFYNPPVEIFSQYQCLAPDQRSPAAVRPLKAEPKASLARVSSLTSRTRARIYKYLRRGDFSGADFNGDGKKDVIISRLKNNNKQISVIHPKTGKPLQTSVFNPHGRLVFERIDSDMDGQVDQYYECRDQICERQFQVVNGKAQRLVRTISSGPDEVIEIYEDKNGKMELVKRTSHPRPNIEFSGDPSLASEGDFCFKCYDENYSKFTELIDNFKAIQGANQKNLPKIDDFYVSRVGVLIHEECFDGRYDFDVEQAVVDAAIQGFECKANLTKWNEEDFGTKGASFYSHIPRLVNLFTNSSRLNEGVLMDVNGETQLWTKPCSDYKNLPQTLVQHMNVNRKCEYVPEVEMGRPKVICQNDQLGLAIAAYSGQDVAANSAAHGYATGPHAKNPAYVSWKGKTKVYNYPTITMIPQSEKIGEGSFKASFWHEIMHNCGYSHRDESSPDYAYFCEAACFANDYSSGKIDEALAYTAERQCSGSERVLSDDSLLSEVKKAIEKIH